MDNVSAENIIRTFVMDFAAFMRFNIYVPDNQNIPITSASNVSEYPFRIF